MSENSHGGARTGAGRYSAASSSNKTSPSRQTYSCPVCGSGKRSDKLKAHMIQLCHFDEDGRPISPQNSEFQKLSKEAKAHTSYCLEKGIKKSGLENVWKRLSPAAINTFENPFIASKKPCREPDAEICKEFNVHLIYS